MMPKVPSTPETVNTDDYSNLPLFACVDCNVYLDANGKPRLTRVFSDNKK